MIMNVKHISRLALLLGLTFHQAVSAALINIPSDQATIQLGIDNALTGDTVLVQPGTYFENLNYNGKNIVVGSLYLTTGDSSFISSTTIMPSLVATQNGSIVTFENGETSAAQLIGFTLTEGTGNYRQIGFDNLYYGGAIYCHSSSPLLSHLIIVNNIAECGGGIFLYSSNSIVENCLIHENVCNSINFAAPDAGGGIACWNCSNATIRNSKIFTNTVSTAGAGIYTLNSSTHVVNCLITGNHSMTMGSAFYADSWSNLNITNCTVSKNLCDSGAGITLQSMLYCIDSAKVVLANTICHTNSPGTIICQFNYSGNELTVSNSDFEGGMDSIITNNGGNNVTINWLSGNFDSDPLFIDPQNNDFRLQNSSPCIDAGDTTGLPYIPLLDLENNDRFIGIIDMGCYEHTSVTGINWLENNCLLRAYPNPVRSQLILSGTRGNSMIFIHDMSGQLISSFASLETETPMNLENISPGIYILNYREADKIISLKFVKE